MKVLTKTNKQICSIRKKIKIVSLVLFFFSLFHNYAFAQSLIHVVNLDFEQSQEGGMPFGWQYSRSSEKMGYKVQATASEPQEGRFCIQVENVFRSIEDIRSRIKEGNPNIRVGVYQEVDASYFRGNDIIFGGKYITFHSDSANYAQFFIQQENSEKKIVTIIESDTLRNGNWSDASVKVRIDSTTKVIKFGFLVYGTLRAKFDNCFFQDVIDFSFNHRNQELNELQRNTLLDLAKIFGTVKYFYPAQDLTNYPWDELIYRQIGDIVNCKDCQEVQDKIIRDYQSLFKDFPFDTNSLSNVENWVYTGLPTRENNYLASQKIVDALQSNRENPATAINFTNIGNEQIKEIEVSVEIKLQKYLYNGKALLLLRVDDKDGHSILQTESEVLDKTTNNWKLVKIKAKIPENAANLRIGFLVDGDCKVLFDDVKAYVKTSNGKMKYLALKNPSFEEPLVNTSIANWIFPNYSLQSGYQFSLSNEAFDGKHSLEISSDIDDLIHFPALGAKFYDTLSNNKVFATPINIPNYTKYTLPSLQITHNPSFAINYLDFYSKIYIIISAWNHIRHFSLKPIPENVLDKTFLTAISQVSKTEKLSDFQQVLDEIFSLSEDPNYKVWYGFEDYSYLPSFGFFIDKDSVFVFGTKIQEIPNGSQILEIDKKPIEQILQSIKVSSNLNAKFFEYKALAKSLSKSKEQLLELKFKTPQRQIKETKVHCIETNQIQITEPNFAIELKPGIVYLNATMIQDEEFKKLLNALADTLTKSIIIDLRGYSLLSEHILGLFTDKGLKTFSDVEPIYTAPCHSLISETSIKSTLNPSSNPILKGKKLVFLINEFSNAYSEVIATLAKVNQIGTLIGTKTQGNYSEIGQIILPGYFFGSQSFMKVKLLNENNYLSLPVEPDVVVQQSLKGTLNNVDDQIEAAIKFLEESK
jgi:C-terminal processing protease CtpA/Prc